ncbi:tyrosine-type recombinase/integrase [Bradyrhizobium sp. ma5]|uniref:tyrosine-type recombinase/integrase n=1 Tax=Bradyrhizobium sp. ma5 TaxID=3344828 RepID=UPI0035D51742
MIAMPRPRPPHLHREINRHGNPIWYVRVNRGSRIRIKAEYGTEEFQEAYQAAVSGEVPKSTGKASKGSLEWLWLLYRQTNAWTDLSMATRRQRENIMRGVLKTGGDQPLSKITGKAIKAGIDRRKGHAARHFLDTMKGLFKWALDAEHVKADPTAGKSVAKPKTKGFPVWEEDEIIQFEQRWPRGTRERVMFDIYCYTGLRRGDAAALGKQHIKNCVISIDTEKTGTRVTIPVLEVLQKTLDAGPTGDLAFIATAKGHRMTKESVGNAFRDACRAAGIKKSAHGLRKAAATRAANNGATEAQLEAIFGWEGGKMAALYTRTANRQKLATGAMNTLGRTETETSIPAPQEQVRASGEKEQ